MAQALAAAGRGVAVLSDDPRFGLQPLRVTAPDGPVHISLYAAWSPDHHAAATLSVLARRLAEFCVERYGAQVSPAPGGSHAARVGRRRYRVERARGQASCLRL